MTTKMTKKDRFASIRAIVMTASQISEEEKTELIAFVDREVELLAKKAASKKLTKTQEEGLVIMDTILDVLVEARGVYMTIADIKAASADLTEYTPQKMSALLKKLIDAGKVVKMVDKKKTYFSAAVMGDGSPIQVEEIEDLA